MSKRPDCAPESDRVRLTIHRFEEGTSHRFLLLASAPIMGFGTHWSGGKGVYCPPADCVHCRQGKPRTWRGYVPALRWDVKPSHWMPTVLEVTESLELDFRDVMERGQVWEIGRGKKVKPKVQPAIIGRLAAAAKMQNCPVAFPILETIRFTYHDFEILLHEISRIPPRQLVSAIVMPGPNGESRPATLTEAEIEADHKRKEEIRRRFLNGRSLGVVTEES